ncbi:MAG: hypothetical protein PUP92_17065 [Rhizonema sp. PD38]|nr:hypothetical protein [Rhizonema sp. PD38]
MRDRLQELEIENGRLRLEYLDEEILIEIRDRILANWRLARQSEKLERIKKALDLFIRQILNPGSDLPKKNYPKDSLAWAIDAAVEEFEKDGDRDRFFSALQEVAVQVGLLVKREPILLSQKKHHEHWNVYSLKRQEWCKLSTWEPLSAASYILKACRALDREKKQNRK